MFIKVRVEVCGPRGEMTDGGWDRTDGTVYIARFVLCQKLTEL